jgi:hypothetical protein
MDEQNQLSLKQSKSEEESQKTANTEDDLTSGMTIVRTNTPRLLPFSLVSTKTRLPLSPSLAQAQFPGEPPEAPPLPEDTIMDTRKTERTPHVPQISQPELEGALRSVTNEFIWLFEYALDMDPVHLNRPERLNGLAFAYGPAALKGYRLVFEGLDAGTGQVLASLDYVQDEPETVVWGLLYRVPRRLTKSTDNGTSLLDRVHNPETFVPIEVQVQDVYRPREITCVTYVASETTRQQVCQLPPESRIPEPDYLQHLLQIALRQKLPTSYVQALEKLEQPSVPTVISLPTTQPEQNTEPIPALKAEEETQEKANLLAEATGALTTKEGCSGSWHTPDLASSGRWLIVFAIYVSLLLIATLILTIEQELTLGNTTWKSGITPPGTLWYVFLYGLSGGCASCLISLGRPRRVYPPTFVLLSWFARPFLGGFLGILAYLILNSGLLLISNQPVQHLALCSIAGALAGLCEGRILLRL